MALAQNLISPSTLHHSETTTSLKYSFLGQQVCRAGFAELLGVGWWPRLTRISTAVFSLASSCPLDPRYVSRSNNIKSEGPKWSDVVSYIETLYLSVAETLPEDACGALQPDEAQAAAALASDDDHERVVHVESTPGPASQVSQDDLKWMPPGSIYQQWRQYLVGRPGCGYRLFRKVWLTLFSKKLKFRTGFRHGLCSVCVQHRLLIRSLSHNIVAQNKQRLLYDNHLDAQYRDRLLYWSLRAASRLANNVVITLILDGMDQAKFAWPRASWLTTHQWDSFNRPRLHVWCALVHGYGTLITVSNSDCPKGGSTTVEVLAFLFTHLKSLGVPIHKAHFNIQLDNTSSSNKNNSVFSFIGLMILTAVIGSSTVNFLRCGHTHEDVDQVFGELSKFVKKALHYAEVVDDFVKGINRFLQVLVRPYEKRFRLVLRMDRIRNWKSYLHQLGVRIEGIGGPSAPHVFDFIKRCGFGLSCY